jgi:hypothetical protein
MAEKTAKSNRSNSGSAGRWREVTPSNPCPICTKPDWCSVSLDGVWCICRRPVGPHPIFGAGQAKVDQSGGEYWLYRLADARGRIHGASPPPRPSGAGGERGLADPDTLHKVYSAFLDHLPLTGAHQQALEARGLKTRLREVGYRTLGAERARAARQVVEAGLEQHLPGVPGFFVQEKAGRRWWTVSGVGGLLVPVRDPARRIIALMIRLDDPPKGKKKYRFVSTKPRGGPGPGTPVHVPLFQGDTSTVRVTEGPLKGDVATVLSGVLTIGLSSISTWRLVVPVLQQLGARTVRVAFDMDARRNKAVALALRCLVQELHRQGSSVEVETWSIEYKGIDDLLAAGGIPRVTQGKQALEEVARIAAEAGLSPSPASGDATQVSPEGRPRILITTEEHEINAAAAAALASDKDIYQRGGLLVRVARDVSPAAKGIRRPFAPRIEALPQPLLRERLAASAHWILRRETQGGMVEFPAHPPAWCVAAVHARADWLAIRHLEAVVDYPVLRPNGTILSEPGYDPETGLLLEPTGVLPTLLNCPTRDDAVAALAVLQEVIADFPFEREVHRAAWLAALLTPLARFAFAGPAPLFLVDANVRAAGKGLLLDTISRIITGERFTIAAYTRDEDELRKRITSLVLAGDRLVLFDNLEGRFGNAVLDAALTGTAWKDRVLGGNRMAEAPLYMTWYATGNNVLVAADTARRACHVRLESQEERPEERHNFRHPNLLAWVGEHRQQLLAATLTILRAYCAAGCPDQRLPAWGSFEGWSALVRSAVVWVGLPDPGETRLLLQAQADVNAESMAVVLKCWELLDPERQGVTAAEVIHRLYKAAPENPPAWQADLRDALETLLGKPDARGLGTRLRSYRRRVFRGRFIDHVGKEHQAVRWAVFPAEQFRGRPPNPPHTPDTPPVADDPGEGREYGEGVSPEVATPADAELF